MAEVVHLKTDKTKVECALKDVVQMIREETITNACLVYETDETIAVYPLVPTDTLYLVGLLDKGKDILKGWLDGDEEIEVNQD